MKIYSTILAGALLAGSLVSCDTKDSSHKETQPFDVLNYVTDGTSERYSLTAASIAIEYIADNGSGLSISNVTMANGSARTFNFDNLAAKFTTGGYKFDATSGSIPSGVSDFSFNLLGGTDYIRQWNPFYSFNVGNEKVIGMPRYGNYFSQTRVYNGSSVNLMTEEASKNRYQIAINDKDIDRDNRTLNIYINGATFDSHMPGMNMVFSDIPFSIENGYLKFQIASLTPGIVTGDKVVPNDKFPITNLSGGGVIGETLSVNFDCSILSGEGTSVTYNVTSILKFRLISTEN